MGIRYENVPISYGEQSKYQDVTYGTNDGRGPYGVRARIWYKADGSIDEKSTYSKEYYNKLHPNPEKNKSNNSKSSKKQGNCLVKIIKLPFQVLWWIVKKILSIFGLAFIVSLFTGNSSNDD